MKKSAPAWTMRGKVIKSTLKISPGPGTYTPKDWHLESSPRYTTQSSPRDPLRSSFTPGPGSYNTMCVGRTSPRPIIGRSSRTYLTNLNQNPGPGTYEIKNSKGQGFTLMNTRKPEKINNFPGPGEYNPNEMKRIKFSISRAKRLSEYFTDSPGPGSYTISPIKEGPSYKISKLDRLNNTTSTIPGPGAYDILPQLTSPSFSMTGRNKSLKEKQLPGPGTYNPKIIEKKINIPISKSAKMPFKPKEIPGPGAYNLEISHSLSTKFSLSPRKLIEISNTSPGPGTYESPTSLDGPRFSLSKRIILKPDLTPVNYYLGTWKLYSKSGA